MQCEPNGSDHHLSNLNDDLLAIHCGIPALTRTPSHLLDGVTPRSAARAGLMLLVDLPVGFALDMLERAEQPRGKLLVVVTANTCAEYCDDLWGHDPAALIASPEFDHFLPAAIARVSDGERYRQGPPGTSSLTGTERAMLRGLARGWDNRRIAAQLHLEEKTVRNTLTRVYTTLGLANRVTAALYYWGQDCQLK